MNTLTSIDLFSRRFYELTKGWTWDIEGFLDKRGFVHPIDTDTKVLSTVFERLASPVIRGIADESGYKVELANQTTYPDFTLTNSTTKDRIAIDVKTTYVSSSMLLTLGGYNSFLRNNTKNILYPYSTYSKHWIIGFIYKQLTMHPVYNLNSLPKPGEIACPYHVQAVFVREKHAITGLRAGSGNTKNIGSVKVGNPSDFATVAGPFTRFAKGKEACDHYWRKYETYLQSVTTTSDLLKHQDFGNFGPLK